jgi:cytochrome oxidase Cu insertion factor (SCO1/SenC/PrrC family)
MSRKTWLMVAAAAAVAVVGWTAYQASSFQMAVETKNAYTDVRSVPSPLTGKPAPDFTLAQVGGGTNSLASFRGRPVLLTFWSSF